LNDIGIVGIVGFGVGICFGFFFVGVMLVSVGMFLLFDLDYGNY